MKKRLSKVSFNDLKWINIDSVDLDTIKKLEKNYNFHHLDLEDCLEENQRSKIDKYPDYNFIILHLPKFKGRNQKYIASTELNIFISENALITIHDKNSFIDKIFEDSKKDKGFREEIMCNGAGYLLYYILNDLFERCFSYVDDITRTLNHLEKEVFNVSSDRNMLKDILRINKDIINFRRIIFPQRAVLAQLEHIRFSKEDEDLEIYFDNIVDKIEKIHSTLESFKELVGSLHQTNETMIVQKTNNVIKVLTIFSVVMLPLTLITGMYGMNVDLPTNNFMDILIIMGIVLSLMLIFFKKKDWL
ncbi:magnesium transporter CorA family protein [bacterium]|jgi:magnesium transporter|nr:magnesium transporter CorA family protein [bacterium]MBT6293949.1 magnesium transporter CorA family protein [bacterium]